MLIYKTYKLKKAIIRILEKIKGKKLKFQGVHSCGLLDVFETIKYVLCLHKGKQLKFQGVHSCGLLDVFERIKYVLCLQHTGATFKKQKKIFL